MAARSALLAASPFQRRRLVVPERPLTAARVETTDAHGAAAERRPPQRSKPPPAGPSARAELYFVLHAHRAMAAEQGAPAVLRDATPAVLCIECELSASLPSGILGCAAAFGRRRPASLPPIAAPQGQPMLDSPAVSWRRARAT
eukprot:CAMPEP_0176299694 /NCGR_PEP_ID=MMETSP0121_2-20121125/59927_1 /TAXON_ID=160619 /ORGANISM="Kryptoperidinium foliaceum, Strain CCMP 1326" /LENGTH=143 /DNA_ID=CAMNT_0017641037 /DNA_START=157 /DNA_END=586 /DNA_ORIENTATION=-